MFERLEENTKFEDKIYVEVEGVLSLTNILRQQRIRFTREYLPFATEIVEKVTFLDVTVRFEDNKVSYLCKDHNIIKVNRLGFDWEGNLVYEEDVFNINVGKLLED